MDKESKRTMDESIKEGAAYSVMFGFGESYIGPYAIFQKASVLQLGLLSSLPHLVSSLLQLFTSPITKRVGSRKVVLSASVLLQAISWLPILFVFMFPSNNIIYLIFFFTVYFSLGMFGTPNWRSIMGDLVPDKTKGTYFGKRNRVTSLTSFISLIIGGLILQFFSDINQLIGFLVIFSIAMVARFVSWRYIDKMADPNEGHVEDDDTKFLDFIKSLWKTNAGFFVIYSTLLIFSVRIASPYFDPYMLNDMGLNYTQYMIIRSASVISTFIFMPIWGKYSDSFGNKRVLALNGLLIGTLPIFWLFSTNLIYLICVQIFAGFVWSGFNLSSFNFLFDAVPRVKNLRYFSYFNVLQGFAIIAGALLGGYLVELGGMFWSKFYIVFLISGLLRILSWLLITPKFKDPKYVKDTTQIKLFWDVAGDVFTNMTQPLVHLVDRKSSIKYKSELFFKKIRKILRRFSGYKY